MSLIQRDDVIDALPPERPDQSFDDAVRLRRVNWRQHRLDADARRAGNEVAAVAAVAVANQYPWLVAPGGGLDHLLPDPRCRRVGSDIEVLDAPGLRQV